jgi:hypothetical protein
MLPGDGTALLASQRMTKSRQVAEGQGMVRLARAEHGDGTTRRAQLVAWPGWVGPVQAAHAWLPAPPRGQGSKPVR